mmetsp:Transcript_50004/g.107617  ORF Transcript_50004/g.107617 Transcript_50004/m.107617 type:complete len:1058 (-) Transcript_50004:606-3779(-)|eukprot:CAMPEP_0206612624 /NCGR_PEP_ID=MMETSP0325_2-20121206/56112_1 /ASSEMBLY_ACC=CAM_ASM_000347 /TAXON_ID=2866 /ORGANISM="Crypthecodinium cohnii, Strain Seligo" /LENGTH=1057 /DNA_ID=CAMNT_0054132375 /DNA_START=68 /DNA_END=3241 /DNA_ORIENTATION=-
MKSGNSSTSFIRFTWPDVPSKWRVEKVWFLLLVHKILVAIVLLATNVVPLFARRQALGATSAVDLDLPSQLLLALCLLVVFSAGALALSRHRAKTFEALEVCSILATSSFSAYMNLSVPDPCHRIRGLMAGFVYCQTVPIIFCMRFKYLSLCLAWCLLHFSIALQVGGDVTPNGHPTNCMIAQIGMIGMSVMMAIGGYLHSVIFEDLHETQQRVLLEQQSARELIALFCDAQCTLDEDGATVIECDERLTHLLGHEMKGRSFLEHLPDDNLEVKRFRGMLKPHQVLRQHDPPPISVFSATLRIAGAASYAELDFYVVGQLSGAKAGKRETKVESYLVGLRRSNEEERAHGHLKIEAVQELHRVRRRKVDQDCFEARSSGQTTTTDEVFHTLGQNRQQLADLSGPESVIKVAMEKLVSLGRKEHWLIEMEQLHLKPGKVLGSGGFGVVMQGMFHGSAVAVKMPQESLQNHQLRAIASLSNELRILRRGRHPNLVNFYGAVVDSEQCRIGLVLELVDGANLDWWRRNWTHHPTVASQYRVIVGVCRALWFLHSQCPVIVHGDLKSANVLVEGRPNSPNAKLLDFGLSCLLTSRARQLGGTLPWVAPEVLHKRTSEAHSTADVFSFGRVVHFVVTGQPPFKGYSHLEIKEALLSPSLTMPTWPRPSAIVSLCKPIVESCLQVPTSRPTMAALHEVLSTCSLDGIEDAFGSAAALRLDRAGMQRWRQTFPASAKSTRGEPHGRAAAAGGDGQGGRHVIINVKPTDSDDDNNNHNNINNNNNQRDAQTPKKKESNDDEGGPSVVLSSWSAEVSINATGCGSNNDKDAADAILLLPRPHSHVGRGLTSNSIGSKTSDAGVLVSGCLSHEAQKARNDATVSRIGPTLLSVPPNPTGWGVSNKHGFKTATAASDASAGKAAVAGTIGPAAPPAAAAGRVPAMASTAAAAMSMLAPKAGRGGACSNAQRLARPDLKETSHTVILTTMMELMMTWNFVVSEQSCCAFHGAVQVMQRACQNLLEWSCLEDWAPTLEAQCGTCGLAVDFTSDLRGQSCAVCRAMALKSL